MTAEELWKKSGLNGEYEAWSFGDDELTDLVMSGKKTATASAYDCYLAEGEDLPEAGDISILLDNNDEAVCIIRTSKVCVIPFNEVSAEHAKKEGEGDCSLDYWKTVHKKFFREELAKIGKEFDEKMPVVYEEFEVIFKTVRG